MGQRLLNRHFCCILDHPLEVFLAYTVEVSIWCRIAVINSVWNTPAHRKLNRVEFVAKGVIDLEDQLVDLLHQLRIINSWLVYIAQVMRIAWRIWHHAYPVASEIVATKISIEIDVFLQHHDQLASLIKLGKEIFEARDLVHTLPATTGVRLHIEWKSTKIFYHPFPIERELHITEGLLGGIVRTLVGWK